MQKMWNNQVVILGKRTPRITDPSESIEQQQVMTWASIMEHKYPELKLLHHIPNGGKRSKSEATRFRAEGVKSGGRTYAFQFHVAVITGYTSK